MQQRRSGVRQRDTRGVEKFAGFALGKAQVGRADLGELAGQAQLMQPQPQIVTRGQHRVHAGGKVQQQPGELGERLGRIQLMQIINNQRDVATSIGELRQHPVDHRRCIEVRCRWWRFCAAGWGAGLTDRVEQAEPELLASIWSRCTCMTANWCGCPGRSAHARSRHVFPLPAGAEMTVTLRAAA